MPENPINLVSLAEAKAYLGVTGSSKDVLIQMLVDGATVAIEDFCQNAMVIRDFTEFYTGGINSDKGGAKRIFLNHYPNVDVASIEDDAGNVIPAADYVVWSDKGILEHFALWPFPAAVNGIPGRWTIEYEAGRYENTAAVSPALKLACLLLMQERYSQTQMPAGVSRQRIGQTDISYGSGAASAPAGVGAGLSPAVVSMLSPYVSHAV